MKKFREAKKKALTTLQISRRPNTKQPSYRPENITKVAISGLQTYRGTFVLQPVLLSVGKLQNSTDAKRSTMLSTKSL